MGQRLRDAAIPVVVVVQPIGGDEVGKRFTVAAPDLHQPTAREQSGTSLGRHLSKRLIEQWFVWLRQETRRLLVVHQDHVGTRRLQPAHTRRDHVAEDRRIDVAQCPNGADLPDHKLRTHGEYVGIQPGKFLRSVLPADTAIDHRDMGLRQPVREHLLEYSRVGMCGIGCHHSQCG